MVARPRSLRVIDVLPDRFDVVAHDAVLRAELSSAIAVCLYDGVQEAGALVHLRVVASHEALLDATDSTRASELLLLDRCVASLRKIEPTARNLQARIAAALPADRATLDSGSDILDVLAEFFAYAGIQHMTPDVATAARTVAFRPSMGQLEIRDSGDAGAALPIAL